MEWYSRSSILPHLWCTPGLHTLHSCTGAGSPPPAPPRTPGSPAAAPGGRKKDPVSCLITGVGGTSWDHIGEAYFTSEILNFPIFGPGH